MKTNVIRYPKLRTMNVKRILLALLVVGLFIYNYLFWQQLPGVNIPIFSIFLSIGLLILNPDAIDKPRVRVLGFGVLLSGIMIAIFGTAISYIMHVLTFFLYAGMVKEERVKSLFFAVWNGITAFLTFFRPIGTAIPSLESKRSPVQKSLVYLRISLLPLGILLLFYMMYSAGNPIFKELTNGFWLGLGDVLKYIFGEVSFAKIFFLLFGLILIGGAFSYGFSTFFGNVESQNTDELIRKRRDFRNYMGLYTGRAFGTMSLKREMMAAVILLVMVNLMLAAVNIIDISWVWLGFTMPAGEFSLKQFVHEGTFMLILSILLSMAILLYYFRRNINFLRDNTLVKTLAYLWIVQNVLLCVSVMLRNYHYIDFHGLAYKRIGVIAFLVMTVVGLITLYIKISERKSLYYLLRVNTWAVWGILLAMTLVNWDVAIAKYNLSHDNPGGIDTDFYLELSPSAYGLLYNNLDIIEGQINSHKLDKEKWIYVDNMGYFKQRLDEDLISFRKQYEEHGWQSKTLDEVRAYDALAEVR